MSIPDDSPGGSKTPEEALTAFLEENGGYLSTDQFRRFESDAGNTKFAYASEGKSLAVAFAEQVGDSWHIGQFAGCDQALGGDGSP
ncbi:hypothetical protein BH20ACT24_BH20ACT24_21810 [soil metagenome]